MTLAYQIPLPLPSFLGEQGQIRFCDSTLRDGEQTADVVFSATEKLQIAKMLDELGVDQIEVGIPAMGAAEQEVIAQIVGLGLDCSLITWNRAFIPDIQASLDCGVDAVALSLPTSNVHLAAKFGKDQLWALDTMRAAVAFAKAAELYVCVSAEDSSRTDVEFLAQYALAAGREGADRFRFCDTLGLMDPLRLYEVVRKLIEALDGENDGRTSLPIELHTHNDFGLAEASVLAGLYAGAAWVNSTVTGLGERAGNAAIEPLAMALAELEGADVTLDTARFTKLATYVSKAASRTLAPDKPIVGSNVFAHESGVHVAGILNDPKTYEQFAPSKVGNARQIVIGKHSGRHAIAHKLESIGYDVSKLDDDALEQLLAAVRSEAAIKKRALSTAELELLYLAKLQSQPNGHF